MCTIQPNQSSFYKKIPLLFNTLTNDHLFTLGTILYSNTTSTIYNATHHLLGKVVVKVIPPEYKDKAQYELYFLSKVQGHLYFPVVLDTWISNGTWYIAMKEMDGTLLELLSGGMNRIEKKQCITQLLEAISFLHEEKKIIHFDLKPENIGYICHRDGTLTFTILDMCHTEYIENVQLDWYQEQIKTGEIENTSLWHRSYEAYGLSVFPITEKVDVWSIGCIIYELVAGTPLFMDIKDTSTYIDILTCMKKGLKIVKEYHTNDPELRVLEYVMKNCLETNLLFRKSASELHLLLKDS